MLVDSHTEHLSGEDLRVLGPAQVQFVQRSTHQLVVMSEAGAGAGAAPAHPAANAAAAAAAAAVQHRHEQDQ